MGDRGNIFFVDSELSPDKWGGLYMYSHWGGSQIAEVGQRALRRGRDRWGDSQYLARIVFCELLGGDVEGETGFGLSTQIGDNGYPILRINDVDQTVALCEPGTEASRAAMPIRSWSYEDFLAVADPDRLADNDSAPSEERVLAAAREVLGGRELELFTNEDTGLVELYVVVNAVDRPVPPNEVSVHRLREKGIDCEEGDELLFPIYFLPDDEERAAEQDSSVARLLNYPINVFAAMRRALDRT